eukprot:Blabericola_migrator_1__3605@NODE_2074_length_3316_cov_595_731302_g1313_i0_p2_GENE_NODE_2074_length_3316_cov_595_731302_g1313_i0NODE_2074_length_3316_cov_595_731302_g1313_i0_p2_ORF_typecomplete_len272_score15_18_NODE_2074_length_3316_cov_595_731302_g1313_i03691184
MSSQELATFVAASTTSDTRSAYWIVLTAHWILINNGFEPVFADSSSQYKTVDGALYKRILDNTAYEPLHSKQVAGEKDVNPSLGMFKYTAGTWSPMNSPYKRLTVTWSSIDDVTVLCHALETKDDQSIVNIGSLAFSVASFMTEYERDIEKAVQLIVKELKPLIWPPAAISASGTSTAAVQANPIPSRPACQTQPPSRPRPDGGLLIGPDSSLYGNVHGIPQPPFRYDLIDPLGGTGDPWPDDLTGDRPRHMDPRLGRGFGGGFGQGFPHF